MGDWDCRLLIVVILLVGRIVGNVCTVGIEVGVLGIGLFETEMSGLGEAVRVESTGDEVVRLVFVMEGKEDCGDSDGDGTKVGNVTTSVGSSTEGNGFIVCCCNFVSSV